MTETQTTETQAWREWRNQMSDYIARRDAAMREVGVQAGSRVEYHSASPWGTVEIMTGTLYIAKNGAPRVRLTDSRKSVKWNKGWR